MTRGFDLVDEGYGVYRKWVAVCGCGWRSPVPWAWIPNAEDDGRAHVRDVHDGVPFGSELSTAPTTQGAK